MSLEAEPMKEDSWSLHEQIEDNQDESYMKDQVFLKVFLHPFLLVNASIFKPSCLLFFKKLKF